MQKLTDHKLSSLITHALHQSGPEGNAERVDINAAYTRAAAVVAALDGSGFISMRNATHSHRPWFA